MFNKNNELELAEIKALTHDLGRRVEEVLAELQSIRRAQDALLVRDREAVEDTPAGGKRARRRKGAAGDSVAARPKQKPRKAGGSEPAVARKRASGTGGKKRRPPEPVARPSDED